MKDYVWFSDTYEYLRIALECINEVSFKSLWK